MLSDVDLLRRGPEMVAPFDEKMVQPASIEMTLDTTIMIPRGELVDSYLDFSIPIDLQSIDVEYDTIHINTGAFYVVRSKQFLLASTAERIITPTDLVARVEGKSSLARLGLFIHVTAGFVDPGFEGKITLEVYNVNPRPIMLRPGMKICQIAFEELSQPAAKPYGSEGLGSHYQGQDRVTESRYGK